MEIEGGKTVFRFIIIIIILFFQWNNKNSKCSTIDYFPYEKNCFRRSSHLYGSTGVDNGETNRLDFCC